MHLPAVPSLAALAGLIRHRLAAVAAEMGDSLRRRGESPTEPVDRPADIVVVAAAEPFATTSFARARLLRQLHASGLLNRHETEQAEQLFGVAQSG